MLSPEEIQAYACNPNEADCHEGVCCPSSHHHFLTERIAFYPLCGAVYRATGEMESDGSRKNPHKG
jgi:hypothetical protein